MTIRLVEDAALDKRHTLRAPARAVMYAEVRDTAALGDLLETSGPHNPVLVLGEGSNILFTRDFDGLVIRLATLGIDELPDFVRVAAGENWHRFVRWSLAHGYVGLENLALIPGSVGAAPIQNIGAYGTELGEFVVKVHAWDRETGGPVELDADECVFTYRDSIFKRERDRWIVTAVDFALPRSRPLRLDYPGVREELAAAGPRTPTAVDVADAIERIRRRKLPDPKELANAGSFFKNPIVFATQAEALKVAHPGLPAWKAEGSERVKVSAAWLLEQCGFKGAREGDAGFAETHALVLVNHGHATGAQLWAFAQKARDAVNQRFGILLEPEPRVI